MAAHQCPACGHGFSVPDWLDTELKCPKCGTKIARNAPGTTASAAGQSPVTAASSTVSVASGPSPGGSAPTAVTSATTTTPTGNVLARWLNGARVRSAVAGALGGFVGWLVAELCVGGPTGLLATAFCGLVVGAGIAAILGSAEGAVIRSWPLAKRGLLIGATVGLAGGALGATCGQLTYLAASPSASSQAQPQASGSFIRPAFSREVAERIAREGGEEGEIEIALVWHNRNDLDLHVVDPRGEEVFFAHPRCSSGGWLDIDQNAGCGRTTDKPIEHVRWTQGAVPQGEYRVLVNHYANCAQPDPTNFHVEVKNGVQVQSFDGKIRFGEPKKLVHTFTRIPASTAPPSPAITHSVGPIALLGVIFGWLLFGATVGCAEGFTRKSVAALRNAAIGGAIGGALGGLALLLTAGIVAALFGAGVSGAQDPHAGWLGRMLGFVILGACIGLWIVLIERALSAMLFVCSGPQEGREIFLDKTEMRVGRNDALEVYLGGDPEVFSHHATVRQEGGAHVIVAVDGPVQVNGQSGSRHQLKHGDAIALGQTRLTYKHKPLTAAAATVAGS